MKQTAAAMLFASLAGAMPLAAQERIPPASSVMPAGYLQAMPAADRVLADMKVADSVQTRARQYAAVSDLWHILIVLTDDHQFRPGLTPDEARLQRGYLDAQNRLNYRSAMVPGLRALMNQYSPESAPFRGELLDRYFPSAWKTAFLTLDAQYHERSAREAASAAPAAAAAAPPPVAACTQAPRRGPPAFDTSLIRLRPQYHGDDLAAIYRAFGAPKDTFETTAQFQQRVACAPSPRPYAFRLPDDWVHVEYNADAAELTVTLNVGCQDEDDTGVFVALGSFFCGTRTAQYPIHMEPGAARRAQGHLGAVLVGVPALLREGGYTTQQEELREFHVRPLSVWLFNTTTGDLLNKHPLTEGWR